METPKTKTKKENEDKKGKKRVRDAKHDAQVAKYETEQSPPFLSGKMVYGVRFTRQCASKTPLKHTLKHFLKRRGFQVFSICPILSCFRKVEGLSLLWTRVILSGVVLSGVVDRGLST